MCEPFWSCGSYGACVNGVKTRVCVDVHNCGTTVNKPETTTTQGCCVENWICNGWSACVNGQQTEICVDTNNCGITINNPATTRSCVSNWNSIDDKIVGITTANAATKKLMYSTRNHSTGVFTRNPDCWAKDFDLSPISVESSYMYSGVYTMGPASLISPRHVILARHASPPVGTVYKFVDMNNNVISRTLVNRKQIIAPNMPTDIEIGILDSDVPAGFGFLKVLPDNWRTKISLENNPSVIGFDQEQKAIVWEKHPFRAPTEISPHPENWNTLYLPADTNISRKALSENIVSGDSGYPSCFVINNQLVIISCNYTGGSGSVGGHAIDYYKTEINAAMATLQGGQNPYQLTEVDLNNVTAINYDYSSSTLASTLEYIQFQLASILQAFKSLLGL
jgi:hypothetical protein